MNQLLVMQWRSNRSIDLLLRANLAPDEDARRAWKDWQRLKSVENATWLEIRLLAPLARRLDNALHHEVDTAHRKLNPMRRPIVPNLDQLAEIQGPRSSVIKP